MFLIPGHMTPSKSCSKGVKILLVQLETAVNADIWISHQEARLVLSGRGRGRAEPQASCLLLHV